MALNVSSLLVFAAVLSWLVSLYLIARLWRKADLLAIKLGLSLVLLAPVLGPLLYFWIQAFPSSNNPDLRDRYMGGDVLNRWRARLEQGGKLRPLVQHWRKRRPQKRR